MRYIDIFGIIASGFTYLASLTGTSSVEIQYIKYELEDLMELDPLSYGAYNSLQQGQSIWICPLPVTMNSRQDIIYNVKIYIAQQMKEDAIDRFSVMSKTIETGNKIVEWLDDNYLIQFPVEITPVLLFDATVEGCFLSVSIYGVTDCYSDI